MTTETATEAQDETVTETTDETAETPTEAPEEAKALTLDDLDGFSRAFAEKLIGQIEEHNGYVAQIKATSTNLDDVMDTVRSNADDDTVVKAQDKIDELNDQLKDLEDRLRAYVKNKAEEILAARTDTTDTAELDTKRKALAETIGKGVGYLSDEYKIDKKLLPLPKVATLRGMSTGSSEDSGRRLRGFALVVDGKDALISGKSTFSAGAKAAGVDTAALQDAYFKAIGTDDAEKFPPSATFSVNGHEVTAYRVDKTASKAS
jgi:hypothetical protein